MLVSLTQQVKMQDANTKETLKFKFNRLLSRQTGDGSLMVELPAVRPAEEPLPGKFQPSDLPRSHFRVSFPRLDPPRSRCRVSFPPSDPPRNHFRVNPPSTCHV